MKGIWKITNTSKTPIKISVALSSTTAPGLILQPGECCLSLEQMTRPLDVQSKRGFIIIENFDNSKYKFPLGKIFKNSRLEEAIIELRGYMAK